MFTRSAPTRAEMALIYSVRCFDTARSGMQGQTRSVKRSRTRSTALSRAHTGKDPCVGRLRGCNPDALTYRPETDRDRGQCGNCERWGFAKLAKGKAQDVHVIQCAMLELDQHAWHGALEKNRQGVRRQQGSRSKRGGRTDRLG